ncbi:MAG: c-type cytochrome [Paracoccaceae bacterium]
MNKMTQLVATGLILLGTSAFAEGDVTKGEKDFKKCKACHLIANGDEVLYKGGKTGPNLYGIVGRQAGTLEGFKYGKSIIAAGEAGLVWDDETLSGYIQNPKEYLKERLGESSVKAKMTFKLKKPENVVAFLASLSE